MHDLRAIRQNPDAFDVALARRSADPAAARILELDARRRAVQTEIQAALERRNTVSREVGEAKRRGEEADDLTAEAQMLRKTIAGLENEERGVGKKLEEILSDLPNLPAADVPEGGDESANLEIRRVGAAPAFDISPKEHFDLGGEMMDFEAAARLSGSRFVVLHGALARMERALANFMLDIHTGEFGYTETMPPALVRDEVLYGTGQLPKFADDLFRTTGDHWLIPTAEVPLTGLVAGQVLNEDSLPLRLAAWTPCFRSEAGAAGTDTRGMIRQHQFSKVELVSVTHPRDSENELERMTECAEEILKRLDLHYRVVILCTGDMGFSASKTYDIEVWLPGQERFREISSCSNCWDFQTRRMQARFRPKAGKGTQFPHSLNGSGLAVGRTLIAVLENFQNADGSVTVPEALRPYMGGIDKIKGDTA